MFAYLASGEEHQAEGMRECHVVAGAHQQEFTGILADRWRWYNLYCSWRNRWIPGKPDGTR